jgi:SAM-dependent methyltransferase
MRRLVGYTELAAFEAPPAVKIFSMIPAAAYEAVLDFGCGCGRLARALIAGERLPRPQRYLGIDLHLGMIRWCQAHLSPLAPEFAFEHHDVFNRGLNPTSERSTEGFPAADGAFTLVLAWSVFTHLIEPQIPHYLRETARVLRPGGTVLSTWFLFEKAGFPMMQEFQNALYINEVDPSNAVIVDQGWLRETARAAGLKIVAVRPPYVRGFQWVVLLAGVTDPRPEVDWLVDTGVAGINRPPTLPDAADKIGL